MERKNVNMFLLPYAFGFNPLVSLMPQTKMIIPMNSYLSPLALPWLPGGREDSWVHGFFPKADGNLSH